MATAESVLKPDHQAKRKHFIFTDEHEQLRESIRSFVAKELAPHAEEWEETTFPDWVFHRMGELDLLGLDKPEAYGLPNTENAVLPSRNNMRSYLGSLVTAALGIVGAVFAFRERGGKE